MRHVDDTSVFGKDKAQHDKRLKKGEKADLTLNEKHKFAAERVKFHGLYHKRI